MNTLKPLLIVAILGGIGYGVYIRLNAGNNVPPPTVAEGWDSTPKVQLPDSPGGGTPWTPPGTAVAAAPSSPFGSSRGAPASIPGGSSAPGGIAPPFAGGSGALGGQAPPYQPQSVPPQGGELPPADGGAPPFAGGPPSAPNEVAHSAAPGGNQYDPAAPPYDPAAAPPAGPPGSADGGYQFTPEVPGGAPPAAGHNPSDYPPPADPYAQQPGDPAAHAPGQDPQHYDANGQPLPPGGAPQGEYPQGDYPPPAGGAPWPDQSQPVAAPQGDFPTVMAAAQRELESGQMALALRQLSAWHNHPQLTPAEQQQLGQLLDQVAGTVVYSTQHLLEAPYEVQPNERLEDIAQRYNVPWQLLAKINGIEDPSSLRPGERLKIVPGPFHAVVNLQKQELTLLLADGSYAGRFRIGIGAEHPPLEGDFAVADKVVNPVYYGRDRAISAEDANNPLGERWIGLGRNMGIHGTNNPENVGRTGLPGSITLSERDVEDVFDILSLGSKVTIRR